MLKRRSNGRRLAERSGCRTQRGFSLWELAILLGLLGLGMAAGFVLLKAGDVYQRETERTALLAAADRAVVNYAAINGRLPCPDSAGDGLENCAAGVHKGWLPVATLGLDASAPARGVQQLRYVVYRGTAADLAALTERFNPSQWSNYSVPASGSYFPYNQLSGLDFCQGLTLAANAAASAANAHTLVWPVPSSGPLFKNIAYAVAEGGMDRDGDGNVFDGPLNLLVTTPGLESPARPADAAYDDRVQARSFDDLSLAFDCQQTTRSLDAMAQALEVVNEIADQKLWSYQFAAIMTAIDAVKTAVTVVNVALAAAALATSITVQGVAAAVLAADSAACAVPLVGIPFCVLIASAATAVAFAIAAIVASGVAVAATVVAFALNTTATIETGIIVGKAQSALVSTAADTLPAMVAQLLAAYNAAVIKAATDLATANTDRAASDAALTAYNTSVTNLKTTAHVHDTGGTNDAALNAVLQKYVDYTVALAAYVSAAADADAMRKRATAAATAATNAATAAAAAAAITPSTPAGIIASTQATADAAKTAETAAKAALAADPTNTTKITAATDASVAAVGAAIDAAKAQIDPVNYVANKQKFAADQLASSVDLAAQATALEATAATKKTTEEGLLTAYSTAATTAANSTAYNWTVGPYTVCDVFLVVCLSSHQQTDSFSDGPAVTAALKAARDAYDTYISKDRTATFSKNISNASAKTVTESLAAYTSLNAAVAAGSGTGVGITISPGADAIVRAADLRGVVK